MNKITLALFDTRKIVLEAIEALLSDNEDIEIVAKYSDYNALLRGIKQEDIQILLINVYDYKTFDFKLIQSIATEYIYIKVLVLSMLEDKDIVFNTLKAGAKGFLTKDTDRSEILEAIYSLRNGYDFYSKSITHILVKDYMNILNSGKPLKKRNDIQMLSERQIEILRLWGDGNTNKEIAEKLFLSVRTVESHKNHIMQKLNLKTTVDLVKFAIKNNIIKI